jgi:hypothetical protein
MTGQEFDIPAAGIRAEMIIDFAATGVPPARAAG